MKKSNFITLIAFVVIIAAVIFYAAVKKAPSAEPLVSTVFTTTHEASSSQNENGTSPTESTGSGSSASETHSTQSGSANTATVSMDDALFIGDSRTVGLSEYAGIDGADFFANVGMNVYNIHQKAVSVPSVGKVTLTDLLNNKKYGKIYLMLGINEIGYPFENTVAKYKELIDFVREKQPDAYIFVQANLHVTKSRSDSDKVINNPAIDKLNSRLSEFADGKKIFYLDANGLFDDKSGSLSADKAGDSAHPYAKYYPQWGKWIVAKTSSLTEEG